ncbi:cytohesin-1-like isoform X1 [Portunus trituberculatus]|uniref:cytohesin-1-like isoform X1 n=1 Tax=Portunus trituberculatus TaxID=210409 RepID=UPI001E1CEA63|nr:cytohesin-1-like isoform X1 [Portunus trituberculatus]XP_045104797.1 cytohesin-1-like isoform X1 [Portunus trituberculatus]
MYRAWAWRAVQCVTCTWAAEDEKGEEDALNWCECGWWRAWTCLEARRSRPLSHSWHHESRLQLGIHEHIPDDHHGLAFDHSPDHLYKGEHLGLQPSLPLHHVTCSSTSSSSLQTLKDEMAEVTAEMEALDTGEDSKNNPKSKQMSIGRKKFNMDPKKGIEYLIDHSLLRNTPDDIAQFLYKGEGLNKTAIGDYLGERNDFNQSVLDAFVCLHDFTDLILVQALRQFLWSFRLPGEAQKIDRMMERFAHRYCELNPSIFQHPDTCFVLSFAIIMLNTSLHNPAVKDKQTIEQFITMNRGIDNGDDLPRELLESLYESIKTEPFKIPEDDGNDLMHTFFNPDREGWLMKQGGRYKSWKRRWFILNDNCLYYFEYTTDKEPRGIIPLENIEVREVQDRNKPNCFELYATSTDFIKACKTDSEGKVVEGKHTVYRMSAATPDEKEEWIKCIRQSISHNPFYDMLAKRKKNIQKNSNR